MKKLFLLAVAIITVHSCMQATCEKERELAITEQQDIWKNQPYTTCIRNCYKQGKFAHEVRSCSQQCGEIHAPATHKWEDCNILEIMKAVQAGKI